MLDDGWMAVICHDRAAFNHARIGCGNKCVPRRKCWQGTGLCPKRAVALADEAWLSQQAMPPCSGDAMAHLRRIQQDESLPLSVRQAAERLTTTVTRKQTAPFTTDPGGDAEIIVECLMPGGLSVP